MHKQLTSQEKFTQMTTEPIPRLIGRLSVPTIISMLITSFYNMADTFFVGQLDNNSATGAVGVVFSLMTVIQALGFFCGHGSGNYISRKLGEQDLESANKMAVTGLFTAIIVGLALAVTGLLLLEPMVRLFGATDTIVPYATDYARYILIGAPWMTASLVLNNQLRFQGSAFYSMIGLSVGAVLNIALDPLLIFVLGMGVGGAALATIISQLVGFILLYIGTTRGGNIAIRARDFTPTPAMYKEIVRGGLPSLFRQGLNSVSTICLNLAAGMCGGDAAIAAMSVVSRITHFGASAVIGFGQGFQPVCGFNYGAQAYGRVRKAFWFSVKVSFCVLLVISVAGLAFAPQLIALFRNDPEVVAIGAPALRYQLYVFPFLSFMFLANMMLQTIGKAFKASLTAMSRSGLFFLPVVLILPRLMGVTGLQLSQPIADVASLFLAGPLALSVLGEMKRAEQAKQAAAQRQ